ncbi:hypothetical protein EII20_07245 [Comamonadaceae bacterium OH2545_COT-014]|nr:hypothetical protein EII20_07245 [Comamonadaceae bacterium OH2545_COT-014]
MAVTSLPNALATAAAFSTAARAVAEPSTGTRMCLNMASLLAWSGCRKEKCDASIVPGAQGKGLMAVKLRAHAWQPTRGSHFKRNAFQAIPQRLECYGFWCDRTASASASSTVT